MITIIITIKVVNRKISWKIKVLTNTAISKTTFPMHVVILACPDSFLVPLRKGGYRGLLKKDSRQAGMTDNVSLLIAFLVSQAPFIYSFPLFSEKKLPVRLLR